MRPSKDEGKGEAERVNSPARGRGLAQVDKWAQVKREEVVRLIKEILGGQVSTIVVVKMPRLRERHFLVFEMPRFPPVPCKGFEQKV